MKKRVLVADDEEDILFLVSATLGGDDQYSLVLARDGEEALKRVQEDKPDLVFLDLKMPKMDGVDVLNKLHGIDPTVPVYIVTAFHQEFFDRLNEAMQAGISFELARKPLSGAEIRTIAAATLG